MNGTASRPYIKIAKTIAWHILSFHFKQQVESFQSGFNLPNAAAALFSLAKIGIALAAISYGVILRCNRTMQLGLILGGVFLLLV